MKRLMIAAAAALLASTALPAMAASAAPAPKPAIGDWGVDTANLSTSVRPGDDFYRYVNQAWLKSTALPTGLAAIDAATELYLTTEVRVGDLIKTTATAQHPKGSPEQQFADFYRSQADMAKRNALGITPIASTLGIVGGLKTRPEIARAMAMPWMTAPIAAGVASDPGNPRKQIPVIVQTGLTMPNRDYYLNPGEPYTGLRTAFRAYVADSFRRAGIDDPDGRAARVIAIETEIARQQWSTAETRDAVRNYHPMTRAELNAFAPGFDWDAFLTEQKFASAPRINVRQDSAVQALAKLIGETPVADWNSYMLFHTLDTWADSLSEEWVNAHFDFHKRKLMGVAARRPRDKEDIYAVNGALGEELGRIYVAHYFPPENRAQVDTMVGYLRASFRDRIGKLPWMDAATRAEAIAKLDKVVSHIGYPDRWHDRTAVMIAPDDLVGNQSRLLDWTVADNLKRLNEGSRDWEFPYVPQEINAGYQPSLNAITFPAGILQPPYFDPAADPAVNFGAIAAVIGHEFGHGFDDQGSKSDGDGKLRDWWTPESRAEFEKRTAGLVKQFDAYEPVPGTHINGAQNLGENIGDLGGLSVAYAAYRKFVDDKQGGKAPVIGGYTGDQRFFLSWAQVWRSIVTDAEQRRRLLSDNHSPGEFRVNGIVRNVDAWYDAFGVKPGDKLYLPPDQRVRIW